MSATPSRISSFALALILVGCGTTTHPTVPADPGLLRDKAAIAERRTRDRFLSPEGLLVYRHKRLKPPDLVHGPYGNLADGACWTGYLLGAEALRCRATGSEEARIALDRVLSGVEMLFDVTGEPGLLARSFDRGVPAAILPKRNGEWRPARVAGYVYRGDVSKDQYAGILFGLGCALRFAPDEELRQRAARRAIRVADRIAGADPAIRDVDGEKTTYGDLSPRRLGIPIAANAILPLTALKLSVLAGGPPEHAERYRQLVANGWARAASFAKVQVLGATNRNNDHIALAGLYHLAGLEEDPETRELYLRGIARIARAVRGEGNAWAQGVRLATGPVDEEVLAECVSALALLPVAERPGRRPGPEGVSGVVPLDMRNPTAFEWRSDPYRAPESGEPGSQYAPIDYLVAYWLLRAHGYLSPAE